MNFKEISTLLAELELDPEKMGTFAQNGDCLIWDENSQDEIEYDAERLLQEHFGEVKLAEVSYFHDGHECWCIYHFVDHNVYQIYCLLFFLPE